jgi:hypothetical protein
MVRILIRTLVADQMVDGGFLFHWKSCQKGDSAGHASNTPLNLSKKPLNEPTLHKSVDYRAFH